MKLLKYYIPIICESRPLLDSTLGEAVPDILEEDRVKLALVTSPLAPICNLRMSRGIMRLGVTRPFVAVEAAEEPTSLERESPLSDELDCWASFKKL